MDEHDRLRSRRAAAGLAESRARRSLQPGRSRCRNRWPRRRRRRRPASGRAWRLERRLLGGDCLNTGCVPSKALLASARRIADARAGADRRRGRPTRGFRRRHGAHAKNSRRDRRERLGGPVPRPRRRCVPWQGAVRGPGRRRGRRRTAAFRARVIATGARPVVPAVPGLAEAGHLTTETVFDLTTRPDRLAVLGSGPVGCELPRRSRASERASS